MAKIRARFKPEDVAELLGSLRVIEDSVRQVSTDDARVIADAGVAFIRRTFPKSSGSRYTKLNEDGDAISRGTPLWSGWRKYPSATAQGAGFIIKHVRTGIPSVRVALASLDQGSKAYVIHLQRAKAFAFVSRAGEKIIRAGGVAGKGKIAIPARRPLPGPDGYILPTYNYIKEQIVLVTQQRKRQMEQAWSRKQSRGQLLRSRYAALVDKALDPD
jgi:hypothetical protein